MNQTSVEAVRLTVLEFRLDALDLHCDIYGCSDQLEDIRRVLSGGSENVFVIAHNCSVPNPVRALCGAGKLIQIFAVDRICWDGTPVRCVYIGLDQGLHTFIVFVPKGTPTACPPPNEE